MHNTRAGVLALLAGFAKYNCDLGLCMISGSGTVLLLRCSGCMALGSLLLFNLRDGSDLPPELDFVRVSFESRTSRLSKGMYARLALGIACPQPYLGDYLSKSKHIVGEDPPKLLPSLRPRKLREGDEYHAV